MRVLSSSGLTCNQFYMKTLRSPEVALKIKEGFIPQARPDDMTVVTEVGILTEESIPAAPTTASLPSTFPMAQRWNSFVCTQLLLPTLTTPHFRAWIFDSPEGFGEWRILVSQRVERDLRRFHKKVSDIYDIVIKKIKYVIVVVNFCCHKNPLCTIPCLGNSRTGIFQLTTRNGSRARRWGCRSLKRS